MATKFHQIKHRKFTIIIMDAPADDTAAAGYVAELKALGVTDVVRTCEPTYSPEKFEKEGLRVHEMMFADGAPPPEEGLQRREVGKLHSHRHLTQGSLRSRVFAHPSIDPLHTFGAKRAHAILVC